VYQHAGAAIALHGLQPPSILTPFPPLDVFMRHAIDAHASQVAAPPSSERRTA
jgi:hypothetical protein